MGLTFEWDVTKARVNATKHEVTFEEASTIFGDARSISIDDPHHSQAEPRQITIGMSHRANILVVVHTERGDNIRVIQRAACEPPGKRSVCRKPVRNSK